MHRAGWCAAPGLNKVVHGAGEALLLGHQLARERRAPANATPVGRAGNCCPLRQAECLRMRGLGGAPHLATANMEATGKHPPSYVQMLAGAPVAQCCILFALAACTLKASILELSSAH